MLRTGRQVGAGFDPELLQLALIRRGRCVIEQHDRRASLAAGDMTLYDTSAAFRIHSAEPYEMLVYAMPRALLGAHIGRLRTRVAVRVPAAADVGGLAGGYLSELADLLERGGADAGDVDLADGVLALVRAAYSLQFAAAAARARLAPEARQSLDEGPHRRPPRRPGLGPGDVARVHHVSTRRVHQLFANRASPSPGWIRARRLDRSRRELRIPRSRTRPSRRSRCAGGSRTTRASAGCTGRHMACRRRRRGPRCPSLIAQRTTCRAGRGREAAVRAASLHDLDLIVLDLGLPDIDGVEVCRRVRAFSDAHVLMLTAQDTELDKVVGFEAGADDYVTKPFCVAELVGRVKAVLRRTAGNATAAPRPRACAGSAR